LASLVGVSELEDLPQIHKDNIPYVYGKFMKHAYKNKISTFNMGRHELVPFVKYQYRDHKAVKRTAELMKIVYQMNPRFWERRTPTSPKADVTHNDPNDTTKRHWTTTQKLYKVLHDLREAYSEKFTVVVPCDLEHPGGRYLEGGQGPESEFYRITNGMSKLHVSGVKTPPRVRRKIRPRTRRPRSDSSDLGDDTGVDADSEDSIDNGSPVSPVSSPPLGSHPGSSSPPLFSTTTSGSP
jgi:hypothetical protein